MTSRPPDMVVRRDPQGAVAEDGMPGRRWVDHLPAARLIRDDGTGVTHGQWLKPYRPIDPAWGRCLLVHKPNGGPAHAADCAPSLGDVGWGATELIPLHPVLFSLK